MSLQDASRRAGESSYPASHPTARRLASANVVSEYLGVPLTTLYNWTQANRIPGIIRVGRRVLFDLDKLDAWLDAGGDQREPEAA